MNILEASIVVVSYIGSSSHGSLWSVVTLMYHFGPYAILFVLFCQPFYIYNSANEIHYQQNNSLRLVQIIDSQDSAKHWCLANDWWKFFS